MTRRAFLAFVTSTAIAVAFAPALLRGGAAPSALPARLTGHDFWQLVVDASEPSGYFRSDNLTSNELGFQKVIQELVARTDEGGVYLGVGPEQNFTYIAAMRPAMAMIVDIRRGNLHVQLMYKGLFELARDRAEFVSMLFAKPRPPVVSARSSAAELFDAFGAVPADEALAARTLAAIERRLTNVHGLRLPAEDLEGIRRVYRAFFSRGFAVRQQPTYADLMTQTDGTGAERSYLASEAAFAFLKDLEARNMIVPLVGDFAGPKALRAVGAFLKARRATVTAFYLSNVEQYLNQDGKWAAFCRNVAALPLTSASTFIRSSSNRGAGFGAGFVTSLGDMTTETKSCGAF